MSASLGRRYERLLFFAGPLTLATSLVFFVALAAAMDSNRELQRCYSQAVGALEGHKSELDAAWSRRPKSSGPAFQQWQIDYSGSARRALIYGATDCYDRVADVAQESAISPGQLILKAKEREAALASGSLQLFGVEVPEKATINVFGTPIKVPVLRFAQALQLALAPVLMLWFASLYNTRYRETTLIARASNVTDVFPHILNVYPTPLNATPPLRKRVRGFRAAMFLVLLVFAITRLFLFLLLTMPAFAGFIASVILLYPPTVTLLNLDGLAVTAYALALGVFGTFFSNLWMEFSPWHFSKVHSPIRDERFM